MAYSPGRAVGPNASEMEGLGLMIGAEQYEEEGEEDEGFEEVDLPSSIYGAGVFCSVETNRVISRGERVITRNFH